MIRVLVDEHDRHALRYFYFLRAWTNLLSDEWSSACWACSRYTLRASVNDWPGKTVTMLSMVLVNQFADIFDEPSYCIVLTRVVFQVHCNIVLLRYVEDLAQTTQRDYQTNSLRQSHEHHAQGAAQSQNEYAVQTQLWLAFHCDVAHGYGSSQCGEFQSRVSISSNTLGSLSSVRYLDSVQTRAIASRRGWIHDHKTLYWTSTVFRISHKLRMITSASTVWNSDSTADWLNAFFCT